MGLSRKALDRIADVGLARALDDRGIGQEITDLLTQAVSSRIFNLIPDQVFINLISDNAFGTVPYFDLPGGEISFAGTEGWWHRTTLLTTIGDSPGAAGVTIGVVGNHVTIHYESGVSTVADVETALQGDPDASALLVASYIDAGEVLTAPAQNVTAQPLIGGIPPLPFILTGSQPTSPVNITVDFDDTWDFGDVVIVGTGPNGEPQTETIEADPGVTVPGVKAFSTVISVTALGQNTGTGDYGAYIGTGKRHWLVGATFANTDALLWYDGVMEAVTINVDQNTWEPTTNPNGSFTFTLIANCLIGE